MPSGFFAAFKVWHLFVFLVIFMGALILNLCPSCSTFLQYVTTSARLCGFASAFYRRCSLPTFRAYQRNMMAYPSHVECFPLSRFHLALCDLRQHRCFPRYFSSFFARNYLLSCFCCWTFPLPLGILPFCCWTFLASWRTCSHD